MVLDSTVTRRKLVLNSADSVTGWYRPSYTDEDIDMILEVKGGVHMFNVGGDFARFDAVGRTQDPVLVGDQIKTDTTYYKVMMVQDIPLLNSFAYRDCGLTSLPLYEEGDEPAESTAGSEAVDPRTRIKTALDADLDGSNITKQDGTTQAPYIVTFGYPPYPFQYVFKSPKRRYVVFAIDEPSSSTANINYDYTAYGYDNTIPIHILCVNQSDATATNLKSKARMELRRVIAAQETIDLRLLDREVPRDRDLGGLMLYDTEFSLLHRTDTT